MNNCLVYIDKQIDRRQYALTAVDVSCKNEINNVMIILEQKQLCHWHININNKMIYALLHMNID